MFLRSGLLVTLLVANAAVLADRVESSTNPVGGGASVSLEPAPPRASQRQRRLVFACRDGGVIIFADRPCSDASLRRELDVTPPSDAGRPATTEPAPALAAVHSAPKHQPDNSDAKRQAAIALCSRLREAVNALDQRMRAGYSAREAARLWNRWREAKAQLHEADC